MITFIKKFFKKQESVQSNLDSRGNSILKILDEGWGHKLSFDERKPIDANGSPLPWFTYPAIEYLRQLDLSKFKILEWGIGNSTLFFAPRCSEIYSIEHNDDWYNAISNSMPSNAKAFLTSTDSNYSNKPLSFQVKFDLIIVDGINRKECLEVAVNILKNSGFIIFDNSDRNPDLCQILRNDDFIQIDFHGFGPINVYTWTTSFFFKRNAKIFPKQEQPLISIGGGY